MFSRTLLTAFWVLFTVVILSPLYFLHGNHTAHGMQPTTVRIGRWVADPTYGDFGTMRHEYCFVGGKAVGSVYYTTNSTIYTASCEPAQDNLGVWDNLPMAKGAVEAQCK